MYGDDFSISISSEAIEGENLELILTVNDNNSNELYSISSSNDPLKLNQLSYNDLIQSSLEKNMLGYTKSAYNALISYRCGLNY